jgi:Mor family transcriptional regulator
MRGDMDYTLEEAKSVLVEMFMALDNADSDVAEEVWIALIPRSRDIISAAMVEAGILEIRKPVVGRP